MALLKKKIQENWFRRSIFHLHNAFQHIFWYFIPIHGCSRVQRRNWMPSSEMGELVPPPPFGRQNGGEGGGGTNSLLSTNKTHS